MSQKGQPRIARAQINPERWVTSASIRNKGPLVPRGL